MSLYLLPKDRWVHFLLTPTGENTSFLSTYRCARRASLSPHSRHCLIRASVLTSVIFLPLVQSRQWADQPRKMRNISIYSSVRDTTLGIHCQQIKNTLPNTLGTDYEFVFWATMIHFTFWSDYLCACQGSVILCLSYQAHIFFFSSALNLLWFLNCS